MVERGPSLKFAPPPQTDLTYMARSSRRKEIGACSSCGGSRRLSTCLPKDNAARLRLELP